MKPADDSSHDIPTLTDLVQPGRESTPRPTSSDAQLDMPLDMPAQAASDPFDEAIAEAEAYLAFESDREEAVPAPAAVPALDTAALLDALEPRIEALVDSALERQARQARDEIVSSVIDALRAELEQHQSTDDA